MSRRRKRIKTPSAHESPPPVKEHGFYTPFSCLNQYGKNKKKRGASQESLSQGLAKDTVVKAPPETEANLFLRAVDDVTPLPEDSRRRVAPKGPTRRFPRFTRLEDAEVLAHLAELVSGESRFSVHFSDEYMDGAVIGLAPHILKRLRNGDFSYQAYVDLHGFTRPEAQRALTDFLMCSHTRGLRCVLVICGRGLNSRGKEPVLKRELVGWLTRAPLKGLVLAFASARTWDGGAGAVYVLLRRRKGKTPVRTPAL